MNLIYLLSVDYYSKYPEVTLLSDTSSPSIVNTLKENFSRNGIPHIVVSDNGPQFQSHEYHLFAIKYNIQPLYSSPQYPRSNCQVERFMQTIKNMLTKCVENVDFQPTILNYCNTPIPELNSSPAQLLMSRRLQSRLPTITSNLKPDTQPGKRAAFRTLQAKQK